MERKEKKRTEFATFAAGCFWGVEEVFGNLKGVVSTQVGYTGGFVQNPSYENVCTDKTGHAEAVQVIYDPSLISYEKLLQVFWENHDPTEKNKQGPDIGSQYRSSIFYHSNLQKILAEESKRKLEESGKYGSKKIFTEIVPAQHFYRAEEYHQKYLSKRGLGTCKT